MHFRDTVVGRSVFVGLEISCAGDVDKDVAEHADGVGVPPEHHVAKSDVIVCCEMCREDASEGGFFGKFNII